MGKSKKKDSSLDINPKTYSGEIIDLSQLPTVAKPLGLHSRTALKKIENMLYTAPSFFQAIHAAVSDEALVAVLTDDQKSKLAKGALKLMTKKDGSILATLINPATKQTVATIPLKQVKLSPEIGQALTSLSSQIQLAQIAEKIESVQRAVEGVQRGQENDRIATALSCQQKFLQALAFQNKSLKKQALLQIAMAAEDSRNFLMKSQRENVAFIQSQPESFWKKMISSAAPKEISSHMYEIQNSLYAINLVSLVEALAYQEIGEPVAAQQSLKYYGEHIQSTFLAQKGFVERLDQLDDSPTCYWSKTIPDIKNRIAALPGMTNKKGLN